MDINLYLNRIDVRKIMEPSLAFLTELQNHHLLSIPFEDLDIPNRSRIELDLNKLYNKIILTGRGGFCYELNGLFYWLLTSLGFKVDMLSARVFNSKTGDLGPEYDHMALFVHLEKNYLVDVGFGDSFRNPIAFPDGETDDISGSYRIFQIENNLFELQRKDSDSFSKQYSFTTIPRKLSDYNAMCVFQQDSPTSHFRTRMLCTIATESGRITLSDNSLTITNNGKKIIEKFTDEDKFYSLLKAYFKIELAK